VIVTKLHDGSLLRDAWVTTVETVVGFAGGLLLGGLAGLLLWWSKTCERVLDPLMVAMNSLPKIALTPIFLLWFGVGISMKIALSFATVFLVTFLSAAASCAPSTRSCCSSRRRWAPAAARSFATSWSRPRRHGCCRR
jgi:ABC-type nitrate/sulfonate/bicarbonate transport system permease component